ncbi:hypothetical protein LINPERPRIM_LOCUS40306 [Linum perenne]
MAAAATIHFVTLIVAAGEQSRTLRLSQAYNTYLTSATVFMRVRTGDTWEVQTRRDRHGILCLTEGLEEYFEFFSIVNGIVLLFEYVGTSTLNVAVFSNNECEIDYPVRGAANEEPNDHSDLDSE